MWLWVIVLVVLIGTIAVLAAGHDDAMVEAYDDRPDATLPAGRPLTAEDLDTVRFSTAMRGYRMDEVDALVARLRADMFASQPATEAVTSEASGSLDEPGLRQPAALDRRNPPEDPPGASVVTSPP